MLAMEADGWAEWAGAAPESPPQAPSTPIGPFELELGELPELVVTWAARLAGTEDALLWLVEPERQRLLVRYGMGRFAASAGRSLHSGEGLAGQAWQTGAPLAVTDYQGWPGWRPTGAAGGAVPAVALGRGGHRRAWSGHQQGGPRLPSARDRAAGWVC